MKLKYNFSRNFFLKNKIKFPNNISEIKKISQNNYTTIGNLYSYNDVAIGKRPVSLKKFNKIINFDPRNKIIEAEAGVKLIEIINTILKKNLILKGVPGNRFVSIGGMIANNTLGKNNYKPFIKDHLISIKLLRDGKIFKCSRKKNKKLFDLTVGGKGTTGIILSGKFRLEKIYSKNIILKKTFYNNINELILKLKKNHKDDYTAIWIDALSDNFDGIIFSAKHTKKENKNKIRKIISIPSVIIYFFSKISLYKFFSKTFNLIFKLNNYLFNKKIYHVIDFFFIQDTLKNWNRVFKNGSFQIQIECKDHELKNILQKIKNFYLKNNIISYFMIIKIIKLNKNKKIFTISSDFFIDKNFNFLKKILNNFLISNNLTISLSKDSISSKINKKTLMKNRYLLNKNKKYLSIEF